MSDRAAPRVSIDGYASSVSDGDTRRSLPELIFGVVTDGLRSADCTMDDVDGVVIAAHDLVDGRSLSSMITGPPAGAYLRDEIRVSDDGLVALSLAAARIESGEASKVVVAAWGRVSEGDPARSGRAAFDPWTEQPFALSPLGVSAMRASAYLRSHRAAARRSAGAARRDRALANPRGLASRGRRPNLIYPLRPDEVHVEADVVAAVVLGTTGTLRIAGIGHGTEAARIGERQLSTMVGARQAITAAYRQAGRCPADIAIAELGGPTLFEEVLLVEAAGLADPGAGLDIYADSGWINPSGGSAAGDCYPAGGLLRLVEALRGLAAALPTPSRPPMALVAAGSAVADQTTVAVVIEAS